MRSLPVIFAIYFTCFMLLAASCSKDYSYEGGNATDIANGSLQDSLGNCFTVKVFGNYFPNSIFTDSNYVIVQANITKTGNFSIYTDTVNGFYFKGIEPVNNSGVQNFKLACFGKPINSGVFTFTLHFGNSNCQFAVSIRQDSAVYIFAENICGQPNVHGVYQTGVSLAAADSVNVLLNVISQGLFSITTQTTNGMVFSESGKFDHTGNYLVPLKGTGTPIAAGTTNIPISIAGVGCSFSIVVTNSNTTNTSMFWQYTENGVQYNGFLDSAIRNVGSNINYPSNTIYSVQVYGTSGGPPGSPITFQLNFARINYLLTVGAYNPGIYGSKDFIGYISHADITGNLSTSNNLPTFVMNLTTYDTTTRLMQGYFSGPVIDHLGQQQTISAGAFSTYYKK